MSTQLLDPVIPGQFHRMPDFPRKRDDLNQGRVWGSGLTKTEAEDLLDWLEMHGHDHCRVSYAAGEGFLVRE
jgi:hypothetical protein